MDTLHEVIEEAVAADQRIRLILGESDAGYAWDRFVKGFISFHFAVPRYRLSEIVDKAHGL